MKLADYTKQPIERKDYNVDYRDWLASIPGDRIVSVVCGLRNPPDDALIADASNFSDSEVKVWVSGGTGGCKYEVEITITTAEGRVDQSELIFRVKEY